MNRQGAKFAKFSFFTDSVRKTRISKDSSPLIGIIFFHFTWIIGFFEINLIVFLRALRVFVYPVKHFLPLFHQGGSIFLNKWVKMRNNDKFDKKLGYRFKKEELLEEALRHSSYVNENRELDLRDNERLEFLGDSVLDLAISHILMEKFTDLKEGDLSKFRATIVNESGLCRVAKGLDLGEYISLGKGEEITNGRNKSSILANTMEAVLGALYLDAGFEKTREIISLLFVPLLKNIKSKKSSYDHKSMLQEYTQNHLKILPEYILINESGLPHNKTFKVAVKIGEGLMAEGTGRSKKEAEQKAAKEAFYCLVSQTENI